MRQPGTTLPDGSTAGVLHRPQGHDQGEILGSLSCGVKYKLNTDKIVSPFL